MRRDSQPRHGITSDTFRSESEAPPCDECPSRRWCAENAHSCEQFKRWVDTGMVLTEIRARHYTGAYRTRTVSLEPSAKEFAKLGATKSNAHI